MYEQSMNHISLNNRRHSYRCFTESPTEQDANIPGFISCNARGDQEIRTAILPHARNIVTWLALSVTNIVVHV